jgi:hypothetical protein
MAGHFIKTGDSWTHLNCPNIYKYKGIIFEFHPYCGPARCNKDLELSDIKMGRKFWKMFDSWQKLSPSKRKRTLIYS